MTRTLARRIFVLAAIILTVVSFAGTLPAAEPQGTGSTVLGLLDTRFTLNEQPMFLLGISYYGALGAPDNHPRRSFDLREQRLIDQLDSEERKVLAQARSILGEINAHGKSSAERR